MATSIFAEIAEMPSEAVEYVEARTEPGGVVQRSISWVRENPGMAALAGVAAVVLTSGGKRRKRRK